MHNAEQTHEQLQQELATLRSRLDRNVADHKWVEGLFLAQQRVLTCLSIGGTLSEVLDILCRTLEALATPALCTIFLRARNRLRLRAAVSLPSSYTQTIDGLTIGPAAASCGTAAHCGKPVIVRDIAQDPLWVNYREAALQHGLRACYSYPILSTHGKVMGTFGLYYRQAQDPTAHDKQLSDIATHLAAVAIKHSRLVKALQRTKVTIATTVRSRGALLSDISHDIRTPAQRVRDSAHRLLETPLSAPQRTDVEGLDQAAAALLHISQELLNFAEIESGTVPLVSAAFRLRQSLSMVIKPFVRQAHEQGLELICRVQPDLPETFLGDAERLGQAIANVVRNALAVTVQGEVVVEVIRHRLQEPRDRNLSTSITLADYADNTVLPLRISVRDTRLSRPEESTSDIRVPTPERTEMPLTGALGLAISQQLVNLMGGWSWVESTVDRGHTFHMAIRCHLPSSPPLSGDSAALAQVRQLPVLVVDDNNTARRVLVELLTYWGLRPTSVTGGQEAFEMLRQARRARTPFALVLLDTSMPGLDGWTLAERIRAQPSLSKTPLVMLSPSGDPEDRRRCQELGFAACLTKPILAPELSETLLTVLLGASSSRRLTGTWAVSATGIAPIMSRRILLAEDNTVNQTFAKRLLEKRGHVVVAVSTGRQALEMLAHETFDVALMDLRMPDMGGLEAVAAIRQHEQTTGGHLPIIAMTAYAMQGDRERCLAAGMDDYIAKPIQMQMLLAAIENAVASPTQEKAPDPTPSQATLVFDQAAALARTEGDNELLKELAALMLNDGPQLLATLHNALAAGNMTTLEQVAHQLKGAVENFAARPTVAAALRLETLSREGDHQGIAAAYATLTTEMQRLMQALRTLVKS